MPLDAADKVQLEEMTALFRRTVGEGRFNTWWKAGSDLTKNILEAIPPDARYRKEILKHLKRVALLAHMALIEAEQEKTSASSG